MRLPSNDVLIAASNSKFHITSNAADNRQIALRQGAMLFEVEPLKSGQRFEVYTPHARAAVRGTIFSVDVTDLRTVFRVYEGVIQVAQRHAIRVINVNEAFATDGAPVRTAEDASLLSEAMRAVRLRENVRQNQLALQRLPEQRTPHNAATSVTEPANTNSDRGRAQTDIRINDIKNPIAQPVYQTPIEAQRRLYQGQAGLALLMARNARATRADVGDWKLVEADALRALGRFEEAADAYWQASRLLHPQGRAQAGYLAAQLYYRDLRRPDRALAILDAAQVDARKSPLRERALLLRAQSMERLGQRPAEIARRYLADYPNSAAADIMRVYLENRDSTRVFQGR
jgi:ferric-dicitrate binding protein FerR (iron transport regulator)